jgi:hypothetical protein
MPDLGVMLLPLAGAAVALMSAKLAGTNSFHLAWRVALPLLLSLAMVIALRLGGLISPSRPITLPGRTLTIPGPAEKKRLQRLRATLYSSLDRLGPW